ncbi:MAG: hypothetical protein IPM54_43165 [Polyangiaceae bacterium]|nr:hypothetical protein [Polyangiaceae bacterium]
MHRKLLGVGAFLLFATFGMLSGVARVAPSKTIALQGDGLQRQEMSEEEKERRREECARMYEYCYDACTKRHPKEPPARGRCQDDCSKKNTECMKKIESNPIEDPDY